MEAGIPIHQNTLRHGYRNTRIHAFVSEVDRAWPEFRSMTSPYPFRKWNDRGKWNCHALVSNARIRKISAILISQGRTFDLCRDHPFGCESAIRVLREAFDVVRIASGGDIRRRYGSFCHCGDWRAYAANPGISGMIFRTWECTRECRCGGARFKRAQHFDRLKEDVQRGCKQPWSVFVSPIPLTCFWLEGKIGDTWSNSSAYRQIFVCKEFKHKIKIDTAEFVDLAKAHMVNEKFLWIVRLQMRRSVLRIVDARQCFRCCRKQTDFVVRFQTIVKSWIHHRRFYMRLRLEPDCLSSRP